jgi:hypothetical protein
LLTDGRKSEHDIIVNFNLHVVCQNTKQQCALIERCVKRAKEAYCNLSNPNSDSTLGILISMASAIATT